jgi:ABC-type multidrug transport system ATPase subunit
MCAGNSKILTINHLNLWINDVPLLHDIHLELYHGDISFILGHNGAGKSLLLKTISGLIDDHIPPAVTWYGLGENPQYRMAYAHQDVILLARKAIDNLRFAQKHYINRPKATTDKEQLENIITLFALDSFIHKQSHQLSGGQKQLLSLAMAYIRQPDVLLLDEPTAHLDYEISQIIEDIMRNIQQHCKIICTSHDMEQPKRLQGNIIIMEYGKIIKSS